MLLHVTPCKLPQMMSGSGQDGVWSSRGVRPCVAPESRASSSTTCSKGSKLISSLPSLTARRWAQYLLIFSFFSSPKFLFFWRHVHSPKKGESDKMNIFFWRGEKRKKQLLVIVMKWRMTFFAPYIFMEHFYSMLSHPSPDLYFLFH